MLFLYNLGIKLYNFILFAAGFFNRKARQWVEGRRGILRHIETKIDPHKRYLWFHFASLGEFEQGRPVLEHLRSQYPQYGIIMTFFSPSGYELRKNYALADHVFYLPVDTPHHAARFIDLIHPVMAVFTKYEYWYHYFNELHKRSIPLYMISAVFRPGQPFFKWYGGLHRKMLGFISHFFVQDPSSADLLRTVHISNVTVSGDTRFDRVAENAAAPRPFDDVNNFCSDALVFVAGSTWPEDEKLISDLVKDLPQWKFIIAPHEIKPEKIKNLENLLPADSSIKYSQLLTRSTAPAVPGPQVLIIDNIGMLSSLYQYGHIAYIGGGFGVGIHNTLEAAAFGIPVIFGPNYQKFLEAKALIAIGGGFTISNAGELRQITDKLQDETFRKTAGATAGRFVQEQKGATLLITQKLNPA